MKNKQISIPTKGDVEGLPELDVSKELEILAAFRQMNLNQYIVSILIEHARGLKVLQYQGDVKSSGFCPSCYLKGKDMKTYVTPINKAVDYGFIQVDSSTLKYLESQDSKTYFVVCPECHWWGWPNEEELKKQDKFLNGLPRK